MKTLESERLKLREWNEKDVHDYFEIYKNPDVVNAGVKICDRFISRSRLSLSI
ncbi:hypothetical protein [Anaeromicropila herbilytica]|uniref:Acetyltransferase n=1 Tax=Anaeromicropila herbilytica TaxID=2785025 RepID=A0A7R7IDF8_9FIRM|nr:hypothetical protein [Anaeromicropila herbilytica]BCN30906.1 hypothetical protein bsdtb5_22010 [Anaeromicropila herbilytica]